MYVISISLLDSVFDIDEGYQKLKFKNLKCDVEVIYVFYTNAYTYIIKNNYFHLKIRIRTYLLGRSRRLTHLIKQ